MKFSKLFLILLFFFSFFLISPIEAADDSVTANVNCDSGPAGYDFCSYENNPCNTHEDSIIAFGCNLDSHTDPDFIIKEVPGGSIGCDTTSFDGDPMGGILKACFWKPAEVPSVQTDPATSVGIVFGAGGKATLNGEITNTGGSNPSVRGFQYGITTSYGATTTENGTFSIGTFSVDITGLSRGTTYHFRAYATNSKGTSYGEDLTFTTPIANLHPSVAPTTTTTQVGVLGTLNSTIINNGNYQTEWSYFTQFKVGGNTIGAYETPITNAGLTRDVSVSYTPTEVGTFTLEVCADSRNTNPWNDVYESDESLTDNCSSSNITINPASPPPPTNLQVTPSACSNAWLNLSWQESAGATSYKVYRDGSATPITLASYSCSDGWCSGSDTGVSLGTTHSYTVKASNAGGDSAATSSVSNTVSSLCTVTFNKNGGDTEANPTSKTVTPNGSNVGTLPTPPIKTGSTFNSWNTQIDGNGSTFLANTPVTSSLTVYAKWILNTYTVTPSAGSGGTISPNVPQTVNYNGTTSFTVTPNPGYTTSVGGTCGGSLVGNTYTTNPVTANCTVVASFTQMTGTLTAPNCTISAGSSSCPSLITWTTTNPIATSAITSNVNNSNVPTTDFQVYSGNSGNNQAVTIFYSSRRLFLYNNTVELASATPTATCEASAIWDGDSCELTTGTLVAPDCTILVNNNSCQSSVSWDISNPISPSVKQDNVQFSTLSSNTGTNRTINYGSSTFDLTDNGVTLNTKIAQATCETNTTWNGSICELNTYNLTISKAGTGSGTVTSSPSGISCGADCSEAYDYNTSVTLSASPSAGSTFSGWSGDSDCSDGQVTMTGARSCTATFTQMTGTLTPETSSCTIAIGSSSCTSPMLTWTTTNPIATSSVTNNGSATPTSPTGNNSSSVFTVPYLASQSGVTTFYLYNNAILLDLATVTTTCATESTWNGSICELNTYNLTISKAGTGSGTITSSPSGISCGTDCSEAYDYNTPVTLSASPSAGSTFSGWSGDSDCSDGIVTMTAARSCTATFTQMTGTLTPETSSCTIAIGSSSCTSPMLTWTTTNPIATSSVTNNGSATPTSPTGNNSSSVFTVPYLASQSGVTTFYLYNNAVLLDLATVTTTCATESTWNGSICELNTYNLTISKAGTGSGTVTSSPSGISCGADCSESYDYNTPVTLSASPSAGSTFSGWSGDSDCSDGQVTMTGARSCTATFTAVTVSVTASPTSYTRNPSSSVSFSYTPTTNTGLTECLLLNWDKSAQLTSYQASSPINIANISNISPNITGNYGYYIRCRNTTYTSVIGDSSQITLHINANPVANAGVDKTIYQPTNTSSITGTATDSDGIISSTTWSFVSGPAVPTITNGSTLNPTFINLNSLGTYVFRLTVTDDGGLTATDDMQVMVEPPPMIGTLTPDNNSCFITAGNNSCNINMGWRIENPKAVPTKITASGMTDIIVSNSLSTPQFGTETVIIPYGGREFYLYNNMIQLVSSNISASCTPSTTVPSYPGTSWTGSICELNRIPTVANPTVSQVATIKGSGRATLGATVTSLGVPNVISARGVCVGTSPSPSSNCFSEGGLTTGDFTYLRTGFIPGTTYYFRGFATNTTGTGYSEDGTFTTEPVVLPTVVTNPVTNIGQISAMGGGNVTYDGRGSIISGLVWSTNPNPTISLSTRTYNGWSDPGDWPSWMYGLTPGTDYYVKAYAVNEAGVSYGEELTFKTLKLPTVVDPTATEIKPTNAILGANVIDLGYPAEISQRGTCVGRFSPSSCLDEGGREIGIFSHLRNGLSPGVTYYYRGFANNLAGRGYSATQTFTTPYANLTALSPSQDIATVDEEKIFTSIIYNLGNYSTETGFYNIFRICPTAAESSQHCPSSVLAKTTKITPPMEADSTSLASINYTFDQAGIYSISACADLNSSYIGLVRESNENDNCSRWNDIIVNPVIGSPDLRAMVVSPTAAAIGIEKTFSSTIINEGNIGTSSGFRNFFQICPTPAEFVSGGCLSEPIDKMPTLMSALSVNATGVATTTHTFTSTGTYSIRACADKSNSLDGGQINEGTTGGEDNNCSQWIDVVVDNGPDLIASAPTPRTATIGDTTISSIIKNQGNVSILSTFENFFQVTEDNPSITDENEMMIDDLPSLPINRLNTNSSRQITVMHNFSDSGKYYVRACADKTDRNTNEDTDSVNEINEGNNCSNWTEITVNLAPVNGECGDTHYDCILGNSEDNNEEYAVYTWNCAGLYGGTTDYLCSEPIKKDGVCVDENLDCSFGQAENFIEDPGVGFDWVCKGINGGDDVSCHEDMTSIKVTLEAIPNPVVKGKTTKLKWWSNGTECSFDNFTTNLSRNGEIIKTPTSPSETYTITCRGYSFPENSASVTVLVVEPIFLEN